MTPEQITAISALVTIFNTFGSLPFGVMLVFVIIGPWGGMMIVSGGISRRASASTNLVNKAIAAQDARIEKITREFMEHVDALIRAQEKRFEAVVRMYENNVQVVKDYHGLSSDLTGIITLSTRTLETLVQKIDNNHFCPVVRKETGKT